MLLIIIEILLLIILGYNLYRIVKRYKAAPLQLYPHPLERLRQALYPLLGQGKLVNIVMFEIKIVYYSIIINFLKSSYNPSNRQDFPYNKTSQFKVVAIVLSIIIVAESVLLHILLEQFVISRFDQAWLLILPLVVHLLNIYVIMFFIGQYKAMQKLPHCIIDSNLIIQNGILGRVSIPIDNISSIQKAKQLGLGDKPDPNTFYAFNKIDSPDLEIILTKPVEYEGTYGKKQKVTKVVVKVDDPQLFTTTLTDRKNSTVSD